MAAADAQSLPFDNAGFDGIVCQFGAIFFPDKVRAFSEVWRMFLFNVWDWLEEDDLPWAVPRRWPLSSPQTLLSSRGASRRATSKPH